MNKIKGQVPKQSELKTQGEDEPFQELKDFNNFEKFKSDPAYHEELKKMQAQILK